MSGIDPFLVPAIDWAIVVVAAAPYAGVVTDPAWQSYDAIADVYERVAALCHAQMARDLVAAVAPSFGARVLDLGAGTGVAAQAASAAVGPDGTVIAADPSSALLRRAAFPRLQRVAAAAPGLPFTDDAFDVVVANLVVGFFTDYAVALADLARVLRPGGRLGVTTWGRLDRDPEIDDADERAAFATWETVVADRIDLDKADAATEEALPWLRELGDFDFLAAALADANLHVVDVVGRAYRFPLSHTDWLGRMHTSARGRYVRAALGDDGVSALSAAVLEAMQTAGIPDPIHCADETVITVAVLGRT
jgi:SAM-dependent methyltransferase